MLRGNAHIVSQIIKIIFSYELLILPKSYRSIGWLTSYNPLDVPVIKNLE